MFVQPKSSARRVQRLFVCLLLLASVLAGAWPPVADAQVTVETQPSIWLLHIDDVIGPAVADYVQRGVEDAAESGASAVILRMDTPGGLDQSMRSIIQAILASPIPIVSYVAPSGARAASAGTYILYASHVAAMAPATNLGAATPVQVGGGQPAPSPAPTSEESEDDDSSPQPKTAMERKIINDAVAYIESLAELRGRNAEWAVRAVREGVSLSAQQALEKNVIEVVATDLDDLLEKLEGRAVTIQGEQRQLQFDEVSVENVEPGWRSKFLAVITNPTVAYVLMLVGVYGLIFEFSNPGVGGPGIAGAISLMVALYAFQVLPISYLGLGLIILGLALMAAEAFAPSFGILGVGGAVSFVIGSIVLMDTELPAYQIAFPVILALAVTSAALLVFVLGMVWRSRRQQIVSGAEGLVGQTAVVEQLNRAGRPLVRLEGELWHVDSSSPLAVGDRVVVRSMRDLILVVDKLAEGKE
ncbi:nodulation protein NfeD [Proteobacteria bacterium 005FR1]|nr:nodulation protein NfeD [Proteobacteria bacterium 005FR1]